MLITKNKYQGTSKDLLHLMNRIQTGRDVEPDCFENHLVNKKIIEKLYNSGNKITIHTWIRSLFSALPQFPGKVDFLPLNRLISEEEVEAILAVMKEVLPTGQFTSGPYVNRFEEILSSYLQKKYIVATSSGTDAAMVALLALGLRPGDEVIMPANSFAATENAVLAVGGVPVFADIDPHTYTLDPASTEEAITPRSRFILPVHLYGKKADMARLRELADRYSLLIVEDACQAIGITGLGREGDALILSFNPYKNVGVCGKGGAIALDNEEAAQRCLQFSYHGFEVNVKNRKVRDFGYNSRMDNLQAAIGIERIKHLSLNNFKRTVLADRYRQGLQPLADSQKIRLPDMSDDHVWHHFPIQILGADRDFVRRELKDKYSAETDIYYPVLSHRQNTTFVNTRYTDARLPQTEQAHSRLLHLPMYPHLTWEEQDHLMEGLRRVIGV
ncbi:DegT/DnrJ/EryC1/StrS family aminotransferase [Paenibacillus sp. 1P03SA]|uniref:DegT/DnrJ/EryC1/StrS family aminotransferase n=1 Tax=Paenibacillus sp. 1P03SA TaxID=3132294 RepID=UPI00399FB9A3